MPRAGLSTDAVVAIALALVDDGGPRGFADLTLSSVAARAGVAVPSLYKHVDGLVGLRREVVRVCVDELTDAVADAAAELDGSRALWSMAEATRALARQHPGRYSATQGATWARDPEAAAVREAGARTVAVIAAAIVTLGVPAERSVDAVRAFRALVHGFVVLELEGGFGMPDDVEVSFRYALDALIAGLAGGSSVVGPRSSGPRSPETRSTGSRS